MTSQSVFLRTDVIHVRPNNSIFCVKVLSIPGGVAHASGTVLTSHSLPGIYLENILRSSKVTFHSPLSRYTGMY